MATKKYDFLVLGAAGIQGKIAARDLLESGFSTYLSDLYQDGLEKILKKFPGAVFERLDLRDVPATIAMIKKTRPDVVINCAEGDWDLNVYNACLETQTHVLDMGSEVPMTEEQIDMDKEFKEKGIIGITGCGSTPGINNIMLAHVVHLFDVLDTVEVGFAWDSNIKEFVVPFSIQSILEEFMDPAPVIANGEMIHLDPMESMSERRFRKIGKQSCFHARHSETFTFHYYYKDKGLQNIRFYAGFPNHSIEKIKFLIKAGFGDKKPVEVDGREIVPMEVLTQTMRRMEFPEGYREKENLWVFVTGEKNGNPKKILMECIVDTIEGWEDAGSNIDTGIPSSIIAQMIKSGLITERGSFAPEAVVPTKPFFSELRKWKMDVYQNGRLIN